jgi:GPH family glycoside/pentoside/hexuronide:cation symporter
MNVAPAAANGARRLSLRTKLAFGVGSIAESAIYIAFNTWNFLFYNHVLGLSGTLCGLAVTISLVLDALANPLIGSLSDRHRGKLGRRHPFLYAAALPLGAAYVLLYLPPAGLSGIPLFLWFTVFATLQRQALIAYHVPHLALGAELSQDYRERSVVMGYNTIFQVVGGAGAVFFGWTWFSKIEGGSAVRTGYATLAIVIAVVSALAILVSAHFTRDQIPFLRQPASDAPPFSLRVLLAEIADCLRNRNYRNLLMGFLCLGATVGTRETLDPYLGLFFWELPASQIRLFGLASPPAYLLAFLITARIHGRLEKRHTIGSSATLLALTVATPICLRLLGLFPANGSPRLLPLLLLFVMLFYFGLAVLTISVLSALADVADEHELQTGKRQEGVFYAARTFFSQLSTGAGHVVAGVGIDLIAFPAGAKPGEVAPDVITRLGILNGPIAAIPAIVAIVFYARYRIDRRRCAEIQDALLQRKLSPVHVQERPVAELEGEVVVS